MLKVSQTLIEFHLNIVNSGSNENLWYNNDRLVDKKKNL